MKMVRLVLATLLFIGVVVSAPVRATAFSIDQSDTWWVANESGWGLEMVQRAQIIFVAMYVYDAAGNPTFYTAALLPTATPYQWIGELVASTGPWFGTVPYNPATVVRSAVGTMTWTAQFVDSGVLTYDVNGVSVTKNIVRTFISLDDFSGGFYGAFYGNVTGCFNPASNGTSVMFGDIIVLQSGSTITLQFIALDSSYVTLGGTVVQAGQFGHMNGTYAYNTGEVGNFTMDEMNVGYNTWSARLNTASTNNGCQNAAYLGGVRLQSQ